MRIVFWLRHKAGTNRVRLDVSHAILKLLGRIYLRRVIATLPYISFALQLKREAPFDELHRFLKRYVLSGCQQQVNVIRHDHECVQGEAFLNAVSLQEIEHSSCVLLDLKKAATACGDEGEKVRPGLLRSETHRVKLTEAPGLKPSNGSVMSAA